MYEYFLIQANSAADMNEMVNEMLAQGWGTYLGLVVGLRFLFQWMIRCNADVLPEVKYVQVEETAG